MCSYTNCLYMVMYVILVNTYVNVLFFSIKINHLLKYFRYFTFVLCCFSICIAFAFYLNNSVRHVKNIKQNTTFVSSIIVLLLICSIVLYFLWPYIIEKYLKDACHCLIYFDNIYTILWVLIVYKHYILVYTYIYIHTFLFRISL